MINTHDTQQNHSTALCIQKHVTGVLGMSKRLYLHRISVFRLGCSCPDFCFFLSLSPAILSSARTCPHWRCLRQSSRKTLSPLRYEASHCARFRQPPTDPAIRLMCQSIYINLKKDSCATRRLIAHVFANHKLILEFDLFDIPNTSTLGFLSWFNAP